MLPSDSDLFRIPLARAGEYELTDAETRTLRNNRLLLVWRVK